MSASGGSFPRAEALLRRVLPRDLLGESIIGDLRQELDERIPTGRLRRAAWFWASTISLTLRYLPRHLHSAWTARRRGHPPREEWMKNLLSDLAFGVRVLLRTPTLSLVAVITIGLGVGITTHIFSVVYGTLLRGIPLPDDARVVEIDANNVSRDQMRMFLSFADYHALREQMVTLDAVGGYTQGTVNLAGDDAPPERFQGGMVTWTTLDLLGVPPLMGRTFTEADDLPEAPLTVVLSYHAWQNRFGGDPSVLGRTIRANSETAEIIGVMPEGFRWPFSEEVWIPRRFDASLSRADGGFLGVVGRLADGSTIEGAQTELDAVAARLAAEFPETNEGLGFRVRGFEDAYMPDEITAVMWVMLAAVFGVLLIACANVANLLLARATLRTKELAVRTAMGASRWRVIRQLLAESAVVAVVGSALGVAIAWWGVQVLNAAILDIEKPYWVDVRLDAPALLFALGLTAVSALLAGIVPAFRASGVGVGEVLKDDNRGSSSFRMGRFSSWLVMGELALSCALLVGAGLMIKSVINLKTLDLGFETEQVMTGRIGIFEGDYPTVAARHEFYQRLEERLAVEPGVDRAALVSSLPGSGAGRWRFTIEGESYPDDRSLPLTWGVVATEGFFEVMGARLLEGRGFAPADGDREADRVVVVNRSFAERFFPDGDAIGQHIRIGRLDSELPSMRVVGVVGDLHVGGGVGGIGSDQIDPEQVYIPTGLLDYRFYSAVVRTRGAPIAVGPSIREVVRSLDPNVPVYNLMPMEAVIDQNTWAFGLFGSLFSIFGVVALFLAAVGLYGVMAFSVTQRRQEMGVRMALGASSGAIMGLVLRRGLVQLGIGLALGLSLGWALARPLGVVLFGVGSTDLLVYSTIAGTLAAAGLLASFLPARSATRTDPAVAMRS